MRKTHFAITIQHLFSPISALSAESKLHITPLRFNVHETLQLNPSNFLISNNTFSRFFIDKLNVHACPSLSADGDRQKRYFTIESF